MESAALYVVLLAVGLLLLLSLLGLLVYAGLFSSIDVSTGEPPVGKIKIAYKFVKGTYTSDCGPLFTEVVSLAPDRTTIGVYYDDPKRTPEGEQRLAVGCILEEDGTAVNEENARETEDLLKKEGFVFTTFPGIKSCVKTTFPFTTQISVVIATWRVYPVLADYVEKKRLCAYPYLEVYKGSSIHFFGPLSQQKDFSVPEYLETVKKSTDESEEQEDGNEAEVVEQSD